MYHSTFSNSNLSSSDKRISLSLSREDGRSLGRLVAFSAGIRQLKDVGNRWRDFSPSRRIFSCELNHPESSSFIRVHRGPVARRDGKVDFPLSSSGRRRRRYRSPMKDDGGSEANDVVGVGPPLIYLERIRMFNNPSSDLADRWWWSDRLLKKPWGELGGIFSWTLASVRRRVREKEP